VAWLKDHAADYRIDPEAIVAGGYSAGAINTLHLLSASDPSPVAGGVIIAGLTPIEATAGDPPMIMHQGTADAIVPFSGAKATCDQTVEVGNVCDFFAYEGGDHFITYIEPHAAQIKDRTARAIFERVLVPLGYEAEQPGDPAAA
jgi:predicted esterase